MASQNKTSRVALPGFHSPEAGFEAPFEMLSACHERVLRTLALLQRLQEHLAQRGCDEMARQAARDVMRYFDVAAPLHHEDEELHILPPLLSGQDLALRELALKLQQDHRQMEVAWAQARATLEAISTAPDSAAEPLDASQTAALQGFAALYQQHLQDEDALAYPAARALVNPEALETMGADMKRRRGAKG